MSNYHDKAKELASRAYTLLVFRESTTDEDDFIYMATNPEIEGCKAQGLTIEEARENLDDVRIDMIEHLLEHDFDVPGPSWKKDSVKDESQEFTRSLEEFFFANTNKESSQQQLFAETA